MIVGLHDGELFFVSLTRALSDDWILGIVSFVSLRCSGSRLFELFLVTFNKVSTFFFSGLNFYFFCALTAFRLLLGAMIDVIVDICFHLCFDIIFSCGMGDAVL